jgi:hypothetical protein
MKCGAAVTLSLAVASLTLLSPPLARAAGVNSPHASVNRTMRYAKSEAMRMIPVEASLQRNLDARKDKPGAKFEARLRETAHLKNGPELPDGTMLLGTVTTDHMKYHGTSRLALRFTEAKLKDGKVIPIKATIVDVSQPSYGYYMDGPSASSMWSDKTLQVDELGAISGVDLHSRIAARNSGVFISHKKDNMKLSAGTRFTLAIAAKKKAA